MIEAILGDRFDLEPYEAFIAPPPRRRPTGARASASSTASCPPEMPDPLAPLVSVLIPCWNAEGSIGRALASVLEERSVPLECVVVDDGSTDRTVDVVRDVAAADPRVVLIALPVNEGVSNARNRGLEAVRGEWLTLLDADDRFMPGGLGVLIHAAVESDALAIVGQQIWWDGERRWRTPRYDIPDIRQAGRKSLAANPGLLNYVSPHAKLLKRACWSGLTFSGRVLGDQPWIIRALLRAGDGIEVLGETVYEWYRPAATGAGPPSPRGPGRPCSAGWRPLGVAREALAQACRTRRAPGSGRPTASVWWATTLRGSFGSDVASHVSSALGRADPAIGELFDAIGTLLGEIPAPHLAASDALARSVLEPPLRRWHRVRGGGRAAYWRLFEAALAVEPESRRSRREPSGSPRPSPGWARPEARGPPGRGRAAHDRPVHDRRAAPPRTPAGLG